jgi:hypothetical protein
MDIYLSVIGVLIVIIGWFVVYFLSKRQDAINKRRDIRIQYLIDAWRLIEEASHREDSKLNKNLEIAVADIQLFGSKKQIELMQQFINEFTTHKTADMTELLIDIRRDLRKELNIEKVPDVYQCLRIKENQYFDKSTKK